MSKTAKQNSVASYSSIPPIPHGFVKIQIFVFLQEDLYRVVAHKLKIGVQLLYKDPSIGEHKFGAVLQCPKIAKGLNEKTAHF